MNQSYLSLVFFIVINLHAATPHITISDFSPETIDQLEAFSALHQGKFTIYYNNGSSWLGSCANACSEYWERMQAHLSLSSICKTAFISLMSLGWISYLICGYLLYKGYSLTQKITSWLHWCSDDELSLMDEDLFYERLAYKRSHDNDSSLTKALAEIRSEKHLVGRCLTIVTFLKQRKIKLFKRYTNDETEERLRKGYAKLTIAEALLVQ